MISAGCDIGSTTAKAVILEDRKLLSSAVIPARLDPAVSAREVMDICLTQVDLSMTQIKDIVGTGYGQQQIPFVTRCESEITCHAAAAFFQDPETRMIIDIGGQDAKVTKLDRQGRVAQYSYNDKCAAGTGRFLEIMADAMGVALSDMGEIGRTCEEKLTISNQCVIFAETEVVSLINEEKAVGDILNALFRAMADRVASQARSLVVEKQAMMTGGVAKNIGLFEALRQSLGVPLQPLNRMDPQIAGAFGAALLAQETI
jgi:predicted CoA-substrate-specific enzyme activase